MKEYTDGNSIEDSSEKGYEKMGMCWANASFLKNKKSNGDKIIISELHKDPRKAIFLNDEERRKCTSNHKEYPKIDWQGLQYYVDVRVDYVEGKIQAYTITHVYDEVIVYEE